MKKLIIALLAVAVAAGITLFVFKNKNGSSSASSSAIASIAAPPASDEAIYTVKIAATQRGASEETTLIDMNATLSQIQQEKDEYLSQWTQISSLNLMGSVADNKMSGVLLNKPMITRLEDQGAVHYLAKDFPQGLTTFQLSFLQKIFVGVKNGIESESENNKPIARTERDEVGSAKVQYVFEKAGANFKVTKTWLQYVQEHIKVDAKDNTLVYGLGPDGRLLSVEGRLTLHYRKPSPTHFTTVISVILKEHRPKSVSLAAAVAKETLQKTDMEQATAIARKLQERGNMTYEEALQKLDTITEKADSKMVYSVFTALKADVIENPEHAGALVTKILETKERDASARRRLSTMFGALAQSESPAIADSLTQLATDCPDNFCKVQAIVGLNDHPQPPEANAKKMMDIANSSKDDEIATTALLAAGSIGKKLALTDLPKALIEEYNAPSKAPRKAATLAAMGNHGSADYYSTLQAGLNSKDSNVRGTAVYSLRYLPNEEVNGTLIAVVDKETDKSVTSEAFKALGYRNLTEEQYLHIAQKSVTFTDADLQQNAARMLVVAYYNNPTEVSPALRAMRDATKFNNVKAYIESELNAKVPSAP